MGASRGWGGAMQPTSPAWAAPQGLPKLPCTPAWLGAWAGNIPHHGQGTSHTTGGEGQHQHTAFSH